MGDESGSQRPPKNASFRQILSLPELKELR
jgi:hypothetical protein